jgi:hypothetical protein
MPGMAGGRAVPVPVVVAAFAGGVGEVATGLAAAGAAIASLF